MRMKKNNFMNRLEFLNRGLQTKQGITDIPLPSNNFPALSMEFQGVPWPDGIHKYSSRLWVCSRISSQLDLPRGCQKGGILIRYLNHLSWNILTWRSSTSSYHQMSELFTLFLRLSNSRNHLWEKCISNEFLVFSLAHVLSYYIVREEFMIYTALHH